MVARLVRDGVGLDYEERGSGDPPILLVHGILCDRRYMAPQLEYFSRAHRTVAVDLRGHGRSDVPRQGYTIDGLAEDLAWMCVQLDLERPVVVGHSLGGIVALALAAPHPDLVQGVVALDSVLLVGDGRKAAMTALLERMRSNDYLPVVREYFRGFFAPSDDPERRRWILEEIGRVPPHVGISVWEDGTFAFDDAAAVAACRAPFLYIDAGTPNVDLDRLHELSPNLTLGRTVGSGHFNLLEVPDQVNAMIAQFLANNAMSSDAVLYRHD
ncbi:MAG: alpha/beta hydrolase [Lapillicoccus sp.]